MATVYQNTTDELDILKQAAEALRTHDKLKQDLRATEDAIKRLCRQYDLAAGVWGFAPHHLRRACETRGLI